MARGSRDIRPMVPMEILTRFKLLRIPDEASKAPLAIVLSSADQQHFTGS
jgi:hypothetical protein